MWQFLILIKCKIQLRNACYSFKYVLIKIRNSNSGRVQLKWCYNTNDKMCLSVKLVHLFACVYTLHGINRFYVWCLKIKVGRLIDYVDTTVIHISHFLCVLSAHAVCINSCKNLFITFIIKYKLSGFELIMWLKNTYTRIHLYVWLKEDFNYCPHHNH